MLMTVFRKDGSPTLVPNCAASADRRRLCQPVYTDDGVFVLTDQGVELHETCGISRHDLAERLVTFQDSCDSEATCLSEATVS
jgi:3-oxoadipate CoA-transferase, beta subunit